MRDSALALVLLSGVLVLAGLIRASPTSASICGIQGPRCPVAALFGPRACPGTGLTRSTAMAMHGRFWPALSVNVAGPFVLLLCAGGIVVHLHVLFARRRGELDTALLRLGRRGFVVLVLAAWIIRILGV